MTLRDDGSFSYDGVWGGYERTHVSGTWLRFGDEINLVGRGSMYADFGRFADREFSTTFVVRDDGSLLSTTGAPGWSLLETRGPLLPVPPDTPPIADGSLWGDYTST